MGKRQWDKFDEEAEREGAALKGRKGRRLDPKRGMPKGLDDSKDTKLDKSKRTEH